MQNNKQIGAKDYLLMSLNSKVQQLAGEITTDEADRKAAGEIRAKEASDFTALEKEQTEIIDTFKQAIGLLERHACLHVEAEECKQCGTSTLCAGSSLNNQLSGCKPADCIDPGHKVCGK